MKMPILAETFSCSAMFSKKEFAITSNLRFITSAPGVGVVSPPDYGS